MPSGNKTLPEPILTKFCDGIFIHLARMFQRLIFYSKCFILPGPMVADVYIQSSAVIGGPA